MHKISQEDRRLLSNLGDLFKLGHFLEQTHTGLDAMQRWGKYNKVGMFRKQSSFEHTLDTVFLTLLVIEKIGPHYPHLDKYALLACATLHELGEIKLKATDIGDVLYDDKQDNNDNVLKELDVFFRFFNKTLNDDELTGKSLPLYLLQYNHDKEKTDELSKDQRLFEDDQFILQRYGLEAKVFEAIERLGYIYDLTRQYDQTPKESFSLLLKVLKNQYLRLSIYSKEIKGFDYFYSKQTHEIIVKLLKKYSDMDVNKEVEELLK